MTRLRLLLACLVMLAIPLQGFAAATMLFCAPGAPHHAAASGGGTHGAAGHDHAAHSHAPSQASQQAAQDAVDAAHLTAADAAHACSVCAACCHSVAISDATALRAVAPPPQFHRTEAPVAVVSRPAVVPEKPPRA